MNDNDPVPDLLLEQLALGELSETEAASVRARLGTDADARLESLRAANAATLQEHSPQEVARDIQRRIRRLEASEEPATGGRWGLWLTAGFVLAAAAAVSIWLARSGEELVPPVDEERVAVAHPPGDTVRLKGDAAIVLRRQLGGSSELLASGDAVSSGDSLLVAYRAAGQKHGALLSVDGAGGVTLHYPEDEGATTSLKPAGTVVLHGFDLDDAPGFERFVFVTADTPIDVAEVRQRVATVEGPQGSLETVVEGHPGWSITDVSLLRTSPEGR